MSYYTALNRGFSSEILTGVQNKRTPLQKTEYWWGFYRRIKLLQKTSHVQRNNTTMENGLFSGLDLAYDKIVLIQDFPMQFSLLLYTIQYLHSFYTLPVQIILYFNHLLIQGPNSTFLINAMKFQTTTSTVSDNLEYIQWQSIIKLLLLYLRTLATMCHFSL